jgi:hypothetical protein
MVKSISAIAVLLLTFAVRLNLLGTLGVQADEGVAITAARQIIAGDFLYADLFWNHTPGVPLIIAFAFMIGGEMVAVARLLSVFAAVISTVSLFVIVTMVSYGADDDPIADFGWFGALAAALLFALSPLAVLWSRLTALESFVTAFSTICMACLCMAIQRRDWKWWFGAGLAAGLAVAAKVSGLVTVFTIGGFLAGWWLIKRDWYPFQMGFVTLMGIAAAWLPFLLLLGWQYSIGDFLMLASGPERLAPLMNWPEKIADLATWAGKRPAVVLALAGACWAVTSRDLRQWLLAVWFLLEGLFLVSASGIEFGWGGSSHYALPFIAAACVMAGIAVGQLANVFGQRSVRSRWIAATATLLVLIFTAPGFLYDIQYALFRGTYPTASQNQEKEIGRVIAASVPPEASILVFGNAAFYHWADRAPADRFFHYPAYLKTSDLAATSDAALVDALASHEPTMIVRADARQYVLSSAVLEAIDRYWTEVTVLPYDYENQGPITLLLPQQETPSSTVSATFANDIRLHEAATAWLPSGRLLVQLKWSAAAPVSQDYTVFVHLVDQAGRLIGQSDGMPVSNTRKTSGWKVNELVTDFHYVAIPDGSISGPLEIRVGLYWLANGERLPIAGTGETHYSRPVALPPAR